eukprot:CCRYP_003098-RA/>CCRYP_003098-RA protein AED:0.21 eAED:0.21 QI:0/0/0/1/1/1/2/0/282
MDNNTIYHVVWTNVSILTATQTPFADELAVTVTTIVRTDDATAELCASTNDIQLTINTNYVDSDTCAADIAHLIAAGVEVDVKQPAPENTVPDNTSPTRKWQLPTTCPCKADDNIKLYVWLGCVFFMACFVGVSPMSLWWSKKDINQFEGAPFRLNNVMSLNRFQAINNAMQYTNCPSPTDFVDRFHDISQLQDAFNTHYTENYIPSYLNCLDKSMKTWLDQKCPGFMALDCKTHPFGNEYHTIADGDDGKPIVWQIKIQDGKDCPMTSDNKHSFPSEFENE